MSLVNGMSDAAQADELTCPFCGKQFPVQDELTSHFADAHGMDGF